MKTYEERRAAEIATENKIKAQLIGICKALGFKAEKSEDRTRLRIKDVEGRDLFLYVQTWRKNGYKFVNVSGEYPRNVKNEYVVGRDESPQSINCSLTKTAEAIAKDIKNRFIPGYDETMKLALKRINESATALNNREGVIKSLASILGVEHISETGKENYSNRKARISEWFGGESMIQSMAIEPMYNGDEVKIDITVKPEVAALLCAVLKNYIKDEVK